MKEYYETDKADLLKGKIRAYLASSTEEVGRLLAKEMTDTISSNNASGAETVMILPVGPVAQYPFFVEAVNRDNLSLKRCHFINMDEYLTDECEYIDKRSSLSFRGFMERNVYSKIKDELNVPEGERYFPDPENPDLIYKKISEFGKVDLTIGGIGLNGHLAFNEAEDVPASVFATRPTRVIKISPETRTSNVIGELSGDLEDMPKYAVTIGMKELLCSSKIRLGVFRVWHRAVVRRALFGEVTGAFPVTLLQTHPDALIYINDIAEEMP